MLLSAIHFGNCPGRNVIQKIIRAMNLTAIILLSTGLMASAKGHSQTVTIDLKNVSIQKVFREVIRQTGTSVVYKEAFFKNTAPITIKVNKASIADVLSQCLQDQPFTFKIESNSIVIYKKPVSTLTVQEEIINLPPPPIEIHGSIKDENGNPLANASVVIKGTNQGVTTNASGDFTINVPNNKTVLIVSYTGYASKEILVGNQPSINVSLAHTDDSMNEIVVTALGISREKRSLVSAVTEVKGSEFTEARENNIANALTGKIAGVNVTGMSSGPGGSSRIVIRGNGSLNGNNQPLYVINGMPMNNTHREAATGEGSTLFDRGDGIAAINPDDVESMTILKGGAAAALYGSQAANGVVLITTKQGRVQKGIGIELNSNFTVGTPSVYPEYQYEYGQGVGGVRPQTQAQAISSGRLSFGEKMDGQPYIQFDGEMRPYSAVSVKDNWKHFYRPATNLTNTVALSGGNTSALVYRLSLSDLRATALEPKSSYNRQTANLNIRSELGKNKKFILEATMQYNYEEGINRPGNGYADNSTNWALNLLANTVDVRNLAPGYDENFREIQWQQVPESQNPYFVINRMGNSDSKHRFLGQGSIQYNVLKNLYIKVSGMRDFDRFESMDYMPVGTAKRPKGIFNSGNSFATETTGQAIINYTATVHKNFEVNVMGGGALQKNVFESNTHNGADFIVPDFISFNNLAIQSTILGFSQFGQNSLFGSADLNYKRLFYLTFTGRNDWFSVLNPGNNSIFYPSVGTSLILSDVLKLPDFIYFAKLRGSLAQVGGATVQPYQVNQSYGFLQGGFGGQPVQTTTTGLSNPNLRPLTSRTYEIGLNVEFLQSRLGIDLTYYNRKTTDDILSVPLAVSSGYTSALLNVGALSNRGVELLLTGKPISNAQFTWDASFNFSYNKSEILKLAPGVKSVGGSEVGDPFNTIQSTTYVTNAKGQRVYNKLSGFEVRGPQQKVGTGVPPYILGLSNSFRYKNFSLDILVDGKFGNIVQSGLSRYMYRFGLSRKTLPGRENGLTVSGVDEDGNPFTKTWPVAQISTYYNTEAGISPIGTSIFDGSFVKLRSVILGYTIPENKLNIPGIRDISISLVARNVALLYRQLTDFDPESSYKVGNDQANTSNTIPKTRDIGINLKVRF